LEVCFAQRSSQALESAIIGRHGEQMAGEVRSLTLEGLALFGSDHNEAFSMVVTVCGSRRAALMTSLNRFLASCNDQVQCGSRGNCRST
jgi:hypothetical protein